MILLQLGSLSSCCSLSIRNLSACFLVSEIVLCTSSNDQIPLERPNWTLSWIKSDQVFDTATSLWTLSGRRPVCGQSRHVWIFSVGLVGHGQSLQVRVVEFRKDMTRPEQPAIHMDYVAMKVDHSASCGDD